VAIPVRADLYSPNDIQKIYLSDFSTDFSLNPITGFLAKVNNEEDAKQMLRNLILTNIGERPFQPLVGSKVYNLLFEPADSVTLSALQSTISQTITNNLPFINLIGVNIIDLSDQNAYQISIYFAIVNSVNPVNLNIVVNRVR
jgi:phage baseplate assembly protein W